MRSVIHRAASWIAQHVVGIADRPEPLCRSDAAAVRVARARRTPKGAGNLLGRRLPGHAKDDVRIPWLATAHLDLTSS